MKTKYEGHYWTRFSAPALPKQRLKGVWGEEWRCSYKFASSFAISIDRVVRALLINGRRQNVEKKAGRAVVQAGGSSVLSKEGKTNATRISAVILQWFGK
jgi:hypothetical protein